MFINLATKPTLLINNDKNVYLSYEKVEYYRFIYFCVCSILYIISILEIIRP